MSILTGKLGSYNYSSPFTQESTEALNKLCDELMEKTKFHEVVIFPFNQIIGMENNFYSFSPRQKPPASQLAYLSFFFGEVQNIGAITMLNDQDGGEFDILGRLSMEDEHDYAKFIAINYLPEDGNNGTLSELQQAIGQKSYDLLMTKVKEFVKEVSDIILQMDT